MWDYVQLFSYDTTSCRHHVTSIVRFLYLLIILEVLGTYELCKGLWKKMIFLKWFMFTLGDQLKLNNDQQEVSV